MKITKREVVYEGFFNVEKVTLSQNGETMEREIFRNLDSVAAIIFNTEKQEFIFVEQYRIAPENSLLEIVAGLLDKEGEAPEKTITREIQEETGYETDKLEYIAEFYTSPGACAEKMRLYYAEVSRKTGSGGGNTAENEAIKTVAFSAEKLKTQQFSDAKTLLAIFWLQAKGRL